MNGFIYTCTKCQIWVLRDQTHARPHFLNCVKEQFISSTEHFHWSIFIELNEFIEFIDVDFKRIYFNNT